MQEMHTRSYADGDGDVRPKEQATVLNAVDRRRIIVHCR